MKRRKIGKRPNYAKNRAPIKPRVVENRFDFAALGEDHHHAKTYTIQSPDGERMVITNLFAWIKDNLDKFDYRGKSDDPNAIARSVQSSLMSNRQHRGWRLIDVKNHLINVDEEMAKEIVKARIRKQLSMPEASELLGISITTLDRAESGEVMMSKRIVDKLREFIGDIPDDYPRIDLVGRKFGKLTVTAFAEHLG